jgi:plastocyanin
MAAACSPRVATPPESVVEVSGFVFRPDALEVEVGSTVVWRNRDRILHTVTSGTPDDPDGVFDETMNGAGDEAKVTFDTPGTYRYFCSRHPFMQGEVRVTG